VALVADGHARVPGHVRSANGSQCTTKVVREWLGKIVVKTRCIEPSSPLENGYVESLNGKLRDELLSGEIFYTVAEARVLIERWREHYNRVRPQSTPATARRHRRRALLDRPPLRSGPSSGGFRIRRLLRNLLWTQQRGQATWIV
jgi:putative transposase